jgi:hypothetical protein
MITIPHNNYLQFWYARQVKKGIQPINDKIFLPVKRSETANPGVVIVPADGSYIRFIANTWYD